MFRNLIAELARAGMSIEAFARALGVSRKTANNKLNGRTEFTLSEIKKTAALFPNISLDYLFQQDKESA